MAEGIRKVGVEQDALAVRAVHDLVLLTFCGFLAELPEDVLKVGLENGVLA